MNSLIFCGVVISLLFLGAKIVPYDSTDDMVNKKRSGLSVYIDHATGVQYISSGIFGLGGTCVRINSDGTPYKGIK